MIQTSRVPPSPRQTQVSANLPTFKEHKILFNASIYHKNLKNIGDS